MYARRFKLQQTCKFVVSDKSPLYHVVIKYKYYHSTYGREEIRTLTNLRFVVSVESPIIYID